MILNINKWLSFDHIWLYAITFCNHRYYRREAKRINKSNLKWKDAKLLIRLLEVSLKTREKINDGLALFIETCWLNNFFAWLRTLLAPWLYASKQSLKFVFNFLKPCPQRLRMTYKGDTKKTLICKSRPQ